SAAHEPSSSGEELGAVARASGFHTRPVTLREGWWRRGGEPLLGMLSLAGGGRTPVALLPSGRRPRRAEQAYELRMPDGRRLPVARQVASSIEPGAWLFYRPLPDRRLGMIDLVGYCRGLRGLARELVLVLAMAFAGALLGLSIPVAAGILVDRVIPEADLQV